MFYLIELAIRICLFVGYWAVVAVMLFAIALGYAAAWILRALLVLVVAAAEATLQRHRDRQVATTSPRRPSPP